MVRYDNYDLQTIQEAIRVIPIPICSLYVHASSSVSTLHIWHIKDDFVDTFTRVME